jgi:hypothetical protein
MKILKILLAASLTIFAVAAAAAVPAPYKTGVLVVDRIVARDAGTVSVHVNSETFEASGCTLSDRFIIDMNQPGGEYMLQMLVLSTVVGGDGPIVRLDGCHYEGDPSGNTTPKAVSIILVPGGP